MQPDDVCTAILAGCQLIGIDRTQYMGLVKLLPCALCGRAGPSDAHHCISGRYGQRRRDDFFTIPLCKLHHQGAEGIHTAQSRWEARFGPDTGYLEWTLDEVRRQLRLQGRTRNMDKNMMRALEADAAMLESLGAGEQPLAVIGSGAGMRLTNAAKGLWEVFDGEKVIKSGLTLDQAEALVSKLQSEHR